MTKYIIDEKGDEVISERHQKDFKKEYDNNSDESGDEVEEKTPESFTDVDFDDI